MIDELFSTNCSTIFLMHPLGLAKKNMEGLGFINCYLADPNKPEYAGQKVVFLLFKPLKVDKFRFFVDAERARTPNFIEEYLLEGDYVVLVYAFPADMDDDYDVFLRGEYSKFSERYKELMLKSVCVEVGNKKMNTYSIQYLIIYKRQEWRELLEGERGFNMPIDDAQEMWSRMNWEDETIHIPPRKIAQ